MFYAGAHSLALYAMLWLALTVWRSQSHSLTVWRSQSHSLTVSQSSVSRKLFRLALWLHLRRSGWRSGLKRGKRTRFQVCGALALCAALWLALWRSIGWQVMGGAHSLTVSRAGAHSLALTVRRSQSHRLALCAALCAALWLGWLALWYTRAGAHSLALCAALWLALTVSQSHSLALTVSQSGAHSLALTVSRAGALALTVSRAGPASEHAFYCHATTEENMRSSHHANMCSAAPRLEQMFDGGYSSAHPFWSAAARGLLAQASYFCSAASH
jgi:hypothetical protein